MLGAFFSALYRFWAPRRFLLFALTLLLLGGGLAGLSQLQVREDIEALLPDDLSQVAADFRRLREAPFARKILIHLRDSDPAALPDAADRLAAALGPPYFTRVMTGPASLDTARLPQWLAENLANLLDGDDLDRLAAALTPERIDILVETAYRQLLSPEGWVMKGMVRRDPLDLRVYGLEKLRYVNPIGQARIDGGYFHSADGRGALIVADSPVSLTDSQGAERLLAAFDEARTVLPPGVTATLVSGHRHTLANATAIKGDLARVLSLSFLAVLAIYLFFLRSWQGVFVFLVPSAILLVASGVIALAYDQVFAVTLGFGGVLLGIADEYAMHIYFACRGSGRERAELVGEVAGPVTGGALATLASFAVMLVSSLPGQRQLAIYAMTGIVAALLLSLVVLPHLVRPAPAGGALRLPLFSGGQRRPRKTIVALWLALLAVSALFVGDLRFDGELRAMSLIPEELRQAEHDLRQAFGDPRGQAMAVVEDADSEVALARNREVFRLLRARLPEVAIVSLAPLLPPAADQRRNAENWRAFWTGKEGRRILADLEAAGARLGFSAQAFAPFHAGLTELPPPVTPDSLRQAGLGPLVDALMVKSGMLTLVPDSAEARELFAGENPARPAGVHFVSPTGFGTEVGAAIQRDFSRYLLLSLLLVLALVVVIFRDRRRILLALVPVVTGLLAMFGIMGALDIPFNLFNIVATVLVIGLCVDYGIFMVGNGTGAGAAGVDLSVLVSGLTTLAGFGVLVLARHPALHSIGVTVLLGIGAAIPAALWVIPALRGERE
ncbi:MMPL family transporter [Trichloromonas sp.]|uniref:MMPL family transporter n=1 Tax=Trichloromonas sp. TaxID=3069249 RepID=UPI002A4B7EE9|nr:MMPL family transporter [Trichloromonas sp.]